MEQTAINQKLFELGYLWSIKESDLLKVGPDTPEFRDAIKSLQATFANEYAALTGKHYGEYVPPEGKVGPAFLDLLAMPRDCPLPDVPPPPGATFHYADPLMQAAVESQQHNAQIVSDSRGSGAWPYGCYAPEYQMHRLVAAVDDSGMPSLWRSHWEKLKADCRTNYSWTGLRIDFVEKGKPADVRMSFRVLSGSTIGLAEFPSGSCRDEVFCYFDPGYLPSDPAYLLNLLQHELGHNNGLQHTSGGVMAPSINRSNPDWRQDSSWNTLKRYYGGKGSPAILGDQPDPVPPPPPSNDFNGVFMFEGKILKIKVFE